jgi:GNAT superfamily N-acetyltransferase
MTARVEPGIDAEWLAERARLDPIRHAWAVWDRLMFPSQVSFTTLREDGRPTAYLLCWHGASPTTVVHWVGEANDPGPLFDALPARPLIAVVPLDLVDEVVRRRDPAKASVLRLMALDVGVPVPPPVEGRARRLVPTDLLALQELARSAVDSIARSYTHADLAIELVFGAFHLGRLASVARAQVALPSVWLIGGVLTLPEFRDLGLSTDVMRLAVRSALAAGARPALYVREENDVARRIYDRLGFRLLERRGWVDAT